MRFVKYSSKEQGSWTNLDNKLMTFDVPLSEDIDHDKSYLILNMSVGNNQRAINFGFGSTFYEPYRSCCLVQNSSIKLDNMAAPLEYNQDINLFMNNKKHYETGFTEQNTLSYLQKSKYRNLKNNHPPNPFLSGVNYGANNVAAVNKTANVIIPLSDVLPSFSKISQKMANKITYQFELDKQHLLLVVNDKCVKPTSTAMDDVVGSAAQANLRQIFTTQKIYYSPYDSNYVAGQNIVVVYITGGVIRYVKKVIALVTSIGADHSLRITTTDDVWADGVNYTNTQLLRNIEGIDFVECDNLANAGNVLTSTGNYDENSNPFYVGKLVTIIYGTQHGGAGDFNAYNITDRTVTEIAFAGGHVEITVDGANIPISQNILISGKKNQVGLYNINKADLVLFQGQFNVEIPKTYLTIEQMPRNKNAANVIDETYLLNKGTLVTYFIQGTPTELTSYDINLYTYRINLDNKPTTEVPVVLNSALSRDIKLRIFGSQCKNLYEVLDLELFQRKLIVEQCKGKSLLQITMNARAGTQMEGNILYMFAIVEREL